MKLLCIFSLYFLSYFFLLSSPFLFSFSSTSSTSSLTLILYIESTARQGWQLYLKLLFFLDIILHILMNSSCPAGQEVPRFYRTQRLITIFTNAYHLTQFLLLSWQSVTAWLITSDSRWIYMSEPVEKTDDDGTVVMLYQDYCSGSPNLSQVTIYPNWGCHGSFQPLQSIQKDSIMKYVTNPSFQIIIQQASMIVSF
jgi:hypothetical protein